MIVVIRHSLSFLQIMKLIQILEKKTLGITEKALVLVSFSKKIRVAHLLVPEKKMIKSE